MIEKRYRLKPISFFFFKDFLKINAVALINYGIYITIYEENK